jgi:hypothetical protein
MSEDKFSYDETKQVVEKSKELIQRGYFTGINFTKSNQSLPKTSILIHFLHDSKKHLKYIEPSINIPHLIVPRFTYYSFRPDYFKKIEFEDEYKSAKFFDLEFKEISIENAIKNPKNITVENKELDLIVPLKNDKILEKIIEKIREADTKGPKPWIDPVLILKTESRIKTLKNFVDKYFISLMREKEEFYSILTDKRRVFHLEKYFDKLCEDFKCGKIKRSDIVFYPSQVNEKFSNYLNEIQRELKIFE